MRVQLQPAFILHSRHYRDTSQLLEVLTHDFGRISLVAKGARRPVRGRSKAAILQPFIPLLISFSGRSELKTLTASEVAGEVTLLRGNRLYSGMYLNELLVRLLHHNDAHPQLFVAYGEAVGLLGGEDSMDSVLRRFEFTLLDELGYSFELDVDGHSGDPVTADQEYQYHEEFGLVCKNMQNLSGVPSFSGADLLAIARGDEGEAVHRTCKRLLRQVLAGHLGDKPLKSRELFTQLRQWGAAE